MVVDYEDEDQLMSLTVREKIQKSLMESIKASAGHFGFSKKKDKVTDLSSSQKSKKESENRSESDQSGTSCSSCSSQENPMQKTSIFNDLIKLQQSNSDLPPFVIDPNSTPKTAWNIIILILVVFQSVFTPVRIAFEEETSYEWLVADYIMDGFFVIDLFINFITAIETDEGKLISERKLIAKDYLSGWFWIDFISVLPVSQLMDLFGVTSGATGNASKFVKLAKLPRIYRILRVVKMIKIFQKTKALQKWVNSI